RLREFVHKRLLDDKGRQRGVEQLHRMLRTLWAGGYIDLQPAPPDAGDVIRGPLIPPVLEVSSDTAPQSPTATTEPAEDEFGVGLVTNEPADDHSPESQPDESDDGADDESAAESAADGASTGLFGQLLQQALSEARPDQPAPKKKKLSAAAARLAGDRLVEESPPEPEYVPERAYPEESLGDLLLFRSVNPLYGRFLIDLLGRASREERVQALESVLELPRSILPQVRVPSPERLPPGPLARGWLDNEVIRRGLATTDDLYPKAFDDEDDPQRKFGGPQRRFAIPFADKVRMLFDSEYPGVSGLTTTAVWVVGDVLHFGGDFQKYVTSRDLTRQEGLVFRHLLRMILLCEEFAQLTPPGTTSEEWTRELREIIRVCTESCRQIDPESTDKLLEVMHETVDVVEAKT
ncbi:MAG: hypothetical protein KDA75_19685, partial [Planctomycetaceae bacterium]|nr:hypothetical protein [Planctomycetaceae bacterium]